MGKKHTVLLAAAAMLCAGFLLWHEGTGSPAAGDGRTVYGEELQDAGRLKESAAKRDTGKKDGQREKQKVWQWTGREWVVEEDTQGGAMGINLSITGQYLLEAEGCLFATGNGLDVGAALYGGGNVETGEPYNIYRLGNRGWEVVVSHPPKSVNDERITVHYDWDVTIVSNLAYYDGFLYYSLLYDDTPGEGGEKPRYIYRVPVQGGEPEELALAYDTFCIYGGKIYYVEPEQGSGGREDVYWEMEPDGTGRREVYRKKADLHHRLFTAGGGCLYVEDDENRTAERGCLYVDDDGKWITGVNLETGAMKSYSMSGMHVEGFCHENGYLYIGIQSAQDYTHADIFRMDVVSGEKEYLANHVTETWLENGYLYYTWNDRSGGDGKLNLSVLNVETKQLGTESLTEKGGVRMQTVGDDLVVDADIYRNMEKEKTVYFRYRAGVLPLERLGREEKRAESG